MAHKQIKNRIRNEREERFGYKIMKKTVLKRERKNILYDRNEVTVWDLGYRRAPSKNPHIFVTPESNRNSKEKKPIK